MCFRERFTELLRKSHISLHRLSAMIDVSEEMIYSYLIGSKEPTLTHVILMAEVLNVSVETLFTGEEIREAPEGDIVKLSDVQKKHLEKLLAACNRRIPPVMELRGRTGLSQAEFSSRYGVSPGRLSRWESGRGNPPEQVLAALSEAVNKDFPRVGVHINGQDRAWRKNLNITFDRKELFVLEIVNHLNRSDAFVEVQNLIRHEPNQDMLNAKQNVLLKLAILSDRDYRNIDTKKCFEGWYGVPSYEGLGDFEAEIRGIMSKDGVILRDLLPGELQMMDKELRVMGIPPYFDDWRDP